MSGHSHFSTIKRQKAITDAKRGKIFSKLARVISVAAKEKGENPETNPALRIAIEKARDFNMPKENIERAIKRGAGDVDSAKLEELILEAYGPGGIAIIIEGITDNKNRALGEIKQILNKNNGKMANEGSVRWMFERKGVLTLKVSGNKEELELKTIEAGAEDIRERGETMDVFTKVENLEKVKKNLAGQEIESAGLEWIAKDLLELDGKNKEAAQKLFEALDENDDVQEIYSNAKL